jgi:lysozyme
VKIPLNANEFSALVSFGYNLGLGSLRRSTLLRLLNEGDRSGAAMQFHLWARSGGKSIPGLHARRLAEQKLFETPV